MVPEITISGQKLNTALAVVMEDRGRGTAPSTPTLEEQQQDGKLRYMALGSATTLTSTAPRTIGG